MLTLNIKAREIKEKPEAVRKAGNIPAVFYGRKEKTTSISLSKAEFLKIWRKAGESSIISLKGVGEEKEALIHDVDMDPVKDEVRHADFYVIEKGKKLQVKVPIEFIGIAPAIKDLGGMLVKVIHELEIEALPKDLPHSITVDISSLKDFESRIAIKDITLPEGVVSVLKPEEIIVLASAPRAEEKVEVAPTADLSTIEVEKKGKEAKEGEAPAEGAEAPKAEKKK